MTSGALVHRALRPAERRGPRARPPDAARTSTWRYVLQGDAWTALAAPVIYSTVVPLLLLDSWISAYQAVCFRLWACGACGGGITLPSIATGSRT